MCHAICTFRLNGHKKLLYSLEIRNCKILMYFLCMCMCLCVCVCLHVYLFVYVYVCAVRFTSFTMVEETRHGLYKN